MNKPQLLVVMFQTADRSNGGVMSLLEIILRLEDFQAVVLTQVETPVNERLRAEGIEVILAPAKLIGSGLLPKLRFSYWLHQRLKGRNFDLAHINDIRAYLHCFPALRWRKIPMVFNLRDTFPPGRNYGWHWRSLRFCNRIICLSKEMQEELIRRLPLPKSHQHQGFVNYVYSIVDFDRFYPVSDQADRLDFRRSVGLPEDRLLVAYVAKVSPKKQQLDYIRQIPDSLGAGFCTVFVGDYRPDSDPYAQKCAAALAKITDGDSFSMQGFQTKVEDFYRACDLVVVPTEREGLARCMIEGMACGLPVVSFELCSAREILEGHHCGVVVQQGQYDRLLEVLKQLAEAPDRMKTFGHSGVATSRALFSADSAIRGYIQIWEEVSTRKSTASNHTAGV